MLSPLFLIKEHSIVKPEATNKVHGMHKLSLMEPMDGLEIAKNSQNWYRKTIKSLFTVPVLTIFVA